MLIVAAVIIGLLALTSIIAIITTIIALNRQPAVTAEPTPPVVETPIATPTAATKYATDAGLLKLQAALASTSAQVDSIDLFEAEIAPPNLDLSINIPPQQ